MKVKAWFKQTIWMYFTEEENLQNPDSFRQINLAKAVGINYYELV